MVVNDVHKTVFVFGEGSMGQHGLGPGDDDIEPIPRPRLQTWYVHNMVALTTGWLTKPRKGH